MNDGELQREVNLKNDDLIREYFEHDVDKIRRFKKYYNRTFKRNYGMSYLNVDDIEWMEKSRQSDNEIDWIMNQCPDNLNWIERLHYLQMKIAELHPK